jgi:hypothetical protein
MPKLTDAQLVILSAAARRDDRAVLPLPKSLTLNKGATAIVLKSLLKRNLIAERPGTVNGEVWREAEDGRRLTLAITDTGLKAIGVEVDDGDDKAGQDEAADGPTRSEPKHKAGGKADLILRLLRRPEGAQVAELQGATGWQPHSVRAALTGLRKRGIDVARTKDEAGVTVYRCPGA